MAAAAVLWVALAWGQEPSDTPLDSGAWWLRCRDFTPAEGTASLRRYERAQRTHARLYGVVEAAERTLFPVLGAAADDSVDASYGAGEVQLVTATEQNWILRAHEVSGVYDDCGEAGLRRSTMMSGFAGAGVAYKGIGLFYGASITTTTLAGSSGDHYATWAFGPLLPILAAPVVPFLGGTSTPAPIGGEDITYRWDWVGGAQVSVEGVDARLGYLGSRGLYTNVGEARTRAFAAAALDDALRRLPYLSAGLGALPVGEQVVERIGRTRLFVRRQVWYVDLDDDDNPVDAGLEGQTTLWDGNVHQQNIGGLVDVHGSVGWAPRPSVRELIVALHPPPDEQGRIGGRVMAGMVNLPEDPITGVAPGVRPVFRADIGAAPVPDAEVGSIHFAVHTNDPTLLRAFPEVRGAWSFYLGVTAGHQ